MVFTSLSFLLFLVVFLLVWPIARRSNNVRWSVLCIFSLFFFGFWDWRFVFLLVASGLIDYSAGLLIVRMPRARRFLMLGAVSANVGILAFFKYFSLLATTLNTALGWPAEQFVGWTDSIVLPIGISFYTFQSMSYTIDVYRGKVRPTHNLLHFFAYLSMFPQLVAGPIIRASTLLPQLESPGEYSAANRWRGLQRITLGFFKKLVIANNIAPFVNDVFSSVDPSESGGLIWWAVALAFAIQIYCDFSGYSDIAIGIALWIGYKFPENFSRPFSALGFREFWSRWHISLSTWFRDYVYIPLGGSGGGVLRKYSCVWIIFLLSGMWHGANWTFALWGAVHAGLLTLERITKWPEKYAQSTRGRVTGICLTFVAGLITWVIFRAEDISQSIQIIKPMLIQPMIGWSEVIDRLHAGHLVAFIAALVLALQAAGLNNRISVIPYVNPSFGRFSIVVVGIVASVFLRGPGSEFIYFQF